MRYVRILAARLGIIRKLHATGHCRAQKAAGHAPIAGPHVGTGADADQVALLRVFRAQNTPK